MNITLQTQLLPDPESAAKLKATVETFNEAASWLAGVAFERKIANKFAFRSFAMPSFANGSDSRPTQRYGA